MSYLIRKLYLYAYAKILICIDLTYLRDAKVHFDLLRFLPK